MSETNGTAQPPETPEDKPPKVRGSRYYSRETIHNLLRRYRGRLAMVAQYLNTSIRVVQRYVEAFDLYEELEQCRELQTDVVETKLYQAIRKGDVRAIIFHLERMGRHRGWGREAPIDKSDKKALTDRLVDIESMPLELKQAVFAWMQSLQDQKALPAPETDEADEAGDDQEA